MIGKFKYIVRKGIARTLAVLAILLFGFNIHTSAQGFEGVIAMSTSNDEIGEKATVNWYIKGDKHRMSISSMTDHGEVKFELFTTVGDAQVKMISTVNGSTNQMDIPAASFGNVKPSFLGGTVNQTNEKQLVSGIECKKYLVRSADGTAVAWVGEIADLDDRNLPSFIHANGLTATLRAAGIKGFPLQFSMSGADGEKIGGQSLISVKKMSISDAEVSAP